MDIILGLLAMAYLGLGLYARYVSVFRFKQLSDKIFQLEQKIKNQSSPEKIEPQKMPLVTDLPASKPSVNSVVEPDTFQNIAFASQNEGVSDAQSNDCAPVVQLTDEHTSNPITPQNQERSTLLTIPQPQPHQNETLETKALADAESLSARAQHVKKEGPIVSSSQAASPEVTWLEILIQFLTTGNLLLKYGSAILVLGVVFLVKLAIDVGFISIEMRLLAVELMALGLIGWGLRAVQKNRENGLWLQSVGLVLSLVNIIASTLLWHIFSTNQALVLYSINLSAMLVLATRQQAVILAMVSIFGGYIAPYLLETTYQSPRLFCTYNLGLTVLSLYLTQKYKWRNLGLLSFVMSIFLGFAVGLNHESLVKSFEIEVFVILFVFAYSLFPIIQRMGPLASQTSDAFLFDWYYVLVTPILGHFFLLKYIDNNSALAVRDAIFCVSYAGAAYGLKLKKISFTHSLQFAYSLVSVVLLTLIIPLIFDESGAGQAWFLEGVILSLYAYHVQSKKILMTGVFLCLGLMVSFFSAQHSGDLFSIGIQLVILLSGVLALVGLNSSDGQKNWLSADRFWVRGWQVYLIGMIFCYAQLFGDHLAQDFNLREEMNFRWVRFSVQSLLALLAGGALALRVKRQWAILSDGACAFLCLFMINSVIFLYRSASLYCVQFTDAYYLQSLTTLLDLQSGGFRTYFFEDFYTVQGWLIPASVAVYAIRMFEETAAYTTLKKLTVFFLTLFFMAVALDFVIPCLFVTALNSAEQNQWQSFFEISPLLWVQSGNAIVGLSFILLSQIKSIEQFLVLQFSKQKIIFFHSLLWAALFLMIPKILFTQSPLWVAPLPYIPFFNILDLQIGLTVFCFYQWIKKNALNLIFFSADFWTKTIQVILFAWVTMVLIRTIAVYTALPYSFNDLYNSQLIQLALAFFWAFLGASLMIGAHRQKNRVIWIAAALILCVDAAKLFLVDLSQVGTLARVISFMGVGLVFVLLGYFTPIPKTDSKTMTAA